jgi:hypothetical protein
MTNTLKISVMAVLVSSLLLPADSTAKAPRFEAIQLVRYAINTEQIPDYGAYYRSIARRTFTYDSYYRQPDLPAIVRCSTTKRVGVTYLLRRRTQHSVQNVTHYAYWSHSSLNGGEAILQQTHRDTFLDDQSSEIKSSGWALSPELRVNGVISVRIFLGDDTLLEDSFTLSDCPEPADGEPSDEIRETSVICANSAEVGTAEVDCS